MASVIVDPDELRRFASVLNDQAEFIRGRMAAMGSEISSAHDIWSDSRFSQFSTRFEDMSRRVAQFCELSDRYVQDLIRDARIIDEYLDRRV